MDQATPEFESDMIDLTKISLDQLKSLGDSALSRALRRLLRDIDDPQGVIAEFNQSI